MDKEYDFLNNLDGLLGDAEAGLSNLSIVQTALAEGIVSDTDGSDALRCTFGYLYDLVKEMRKEVRSAFERMGILA